MRLSASFFRRVKHSIIEYIFVEKLLDKLETDAAIRARDHSNGRDRGRHVDDVMESME